jgi:hypothetical protein
MGLDDPGPGSSAFHFRFSVSLQVVGVGWSSGLTPEPLGPRNRGQSAESPLLAATSAKEAAAVIKIERRMILSPLENSN